MNEDNRDPEPATMSRQELIDEVIRLRAQIADDQDYYRKCRDMMADKLHSYNDKFNLQEEVIADLTCQVQCNLDNREKSAYESKDAAMEMTRVPRLDRPADSILPKFEASGLF